MANTELTRGKLINDLLRYLKVQHKLTAWKDGPFLYYLDCGKLRCLFVATPGGYILPRTQTKWLEELEAAGAKTAAVGSLDEVRDLILGEWA
jgi:hypothetical protein